MEFYHESDNVKRVRSFYAAIARGDFIAARQYLDPNLEWVEPTVPGLWFTGTYKGPEAVFKNVIEPTYGKIADFRIKPKKLYDVGDHVIVLGRFLGRTKMNGRELDAPTAHIWTLRNGKAVRFEAYHETSKWLQALGDTAPQTERLAA